MISLRNLLFQCLLNVFSSKTAFSTDVHKIYLHSNDPVLCNSAMQSGIFWISVVFNSNQIHVKGFWISRLHLIHKCVSTKFHVLSFSICSKLATSLCSRGGMQISIAKRRILLQKIMHMQIFLPTQRSRRSYKLYSQLLWQMEIYLQHGKIT